MRRIAAVLAVTLALTACGEPNDAEGWARRAVSKTRTEEKLEALEQARKAPGDHRPAVPHLLKLLDPAADVSPRVRAAAAGALGEIGDASAVPALLAAVAPDKHDRDTVDANRRIAEALGALRSPEALPVLEQLTASPDGFTQVAAVDALASIGDPRAVPRLVELAASEATEPFVAGKALLALGRIGDPSAAPVVLRMLFAQRRGLPLFREASAATVGIGPPMAAPLLAVMEGKDGAFSAWAAERRLPPALVQAKAAQLLGDVGGPEAIPALVGRLGYEDADGEWKLLVRAVAAESLGRLRAREAVKPLSDLVGREGLAQVRDRYCGALARIGDPSALPALRAAAAGARSWELRHAPLLAISRLGGPDDAALVAAAAQACGGACPKPEADALDGMRRRLEVARACAADLACWTGKLADASAPVRDRAALEVGHSGGAAQAPALAAALVRPVDGEDALAARYHAVLALSWIGRGPLDGKGRELADGIEKAIAAEPRGRKLTEGVNEDALRLAAALRRAK
jgi:HEAT repeat protein